MADGTSYTEKTGVLTLAQQQHRNRLALAELLETRVTDAEYRQWRYAPAAGACGCALHHARRFGLIESAGATSETFGDGAWDIFAGDPKSHNGTRLGAAAALRAWEAE